MSNKTPAKQPDETESAHRKNPLHLGIGLLLVVFGLLALWNGISAVTDERKRLIAPQGVVLVEIADDPTERSNGLSGREVLNEGEGMLFMFDETSDEHCFWMKDTTIPLDMIWLNENKQVVFIHRNATPLSELSICPDEPARYVLEVSAGQADSLRIKEGEKLAF